MNFFVPNRIIAGLAGIFHGDIGQPQQIIYNAGAHAAAGQVEPVLDIALDILMRTGLDDDFSREFRHNFEDSEAILELVAEAESAATLVETGAGEEAGGDILVGEPAAEQDIVCGVACFDIGFGERAPEGFGLGEFFGRTPPRLLRRHPSGGGEYAQLESELFCGVGGDGDCGFD